jgi:peptide deformylase
METAKTEEVSSSSKNKNEQLILTSGEEGSQVQKVAEDDKTPLLNLVPDSEKILREAIPTYDFESEPHATRMMFVNSIIKTMNAYGGLGLSANQVGVFKRAFVMHRIEVGTEGKTEILVCFNPEVIRVIEGEKVMREYCLTFPGLSLQVKRPTIIEVSYQDEFGQFFELELEGVNAKCFLHELDHLNGILFVDKVSKPILALEKEKQRKLVRKQRKAYERSVQQFRTFSKNNGGIPGLYQFRKPNLTSFLVEQCLQSMAGEAKLKEDSGAVSERQDGLDGEKLALPQE